MDKTVLIYSQRTLSNRHRFVFDFLFIENLPDFNEYNSNQQNRFITLIDIIYEKKIPLMITSPVNLDLIKSSKSLKETFKRTISRLYELTSSNYN